MGLLHPNKQRVINQLVETWAKYPDLQLCQLLGNLPGQDKYHLTDKELVILLRVYKDHLATP